MDVADFPGGEGLNCFSFIHHKNELEFPSPWRITLSDLKKIYYWDWAKGSGMFNSRWSHTSCSNFNWTCFFFFFNKYSVVCRKCWNDIPTFHWCKSKCHSRTQWIGCRCYSTWANSMTVSKSKHIKWYCKSFFPEAIRLHPFCREGFLKPKHWVLYCWVSRMFIHIEL